MPVAYFPVTTREREHGISLGLQITFFPAQAHFSKITPFPCLFPKERKCVRKSEWEEMEASPRYPNFMFLTRKERLNRGEAGTREFKPSTFTSETPPILIIIIF
jgi:hypothetical protein